MLTADFDFTLPPERIALRPAHPREEARLLLVGAQNANLQVADLPKILQKGDILVFNDTRVIPASLTGVRVGRLNTKPRIEALLHLRLDSARWLAFVKPARKLIVGDKLEFGTLVAQVTHKGEAGEVTFQFACSGADLDLALGQVGQVPLPPYIESKRAIDDQDRADYQTIFAQKSGAVAAPTAGLHFTPDLMKKLEQYEIKHEFVTLHVGAGTFLPVKTEEVAAHKMHAEWGEISPDVAARLKQARKAGARIIAVGTTSLRILEASGLNAFAGTTNIFITPGYKFHAVDGLLTNFHLPRSTLFMLVCAFAGTKRMRAAYDYAINQQYRFYSYGDCCLLFPERE